MLSVTVAAAAAFRCLQKAWLHELIVFMKAHRTMLVPAVMMMCYSLCQRSHVDNYQPTVAVLLGYWLLVNSSQCNLYHKTNNCAILLICAESEQLFNIMSQYTIWVQFYVYLTAQYTPNQFCIYSWDRLTVFAMQQKRGFSIGILI